MTDAVIVALITGGLSVLGVIISNIGSNRKIEDALSTSQAVTDCKIEELTREVRSITISQDVCQLLSNRLWLLKRI